jgi:hypothetical protein
MPNDTSDPDLAEPEEGGDAPRGRGAPSSARELALRAELIQVRHELRQLLTELEHTSEVAAEPNCSVVVTSVVLRPVLLPRRER